MSGAFDSTSFIKYVTRHKYAISSLFLLFSLACIASVYTGFLEDDSWAAPEIQHNSAYQEARRYIDGHLDLKEGMWDTAIINGKAYNVFQPGQTFYFIVHIWLGEMSFKYIQLELVLFTLLSAILMGAWTIRLTDGNILLPSLLVLSFYLGAPYMPSFRVGLLGSVYRIGHVFSILFMNAIILLVSFGPTRRTLAGIGIVAFFAILFRGQNILILCLPILVYFVSVETGRWDVGKLRSIRKEWKLNAANLAILVVPPILAVLIILIIQNLKFGSPFDAGYSLIYNNREDFLAVRAKEHGLFSLHYLAENLYRTFFAAPELEWSGWKIEEWHGKEFGNSLIFTQPVLLIALMFFARSIRFAKVQAFLITGVVLSIPVFLYHNPGYKALGYMRLALDYLPVWFAFLAVGIRYSGHRWIYTVLALPLCYWAYCLAAILWP